MTGKHPRTKPLLGALAAVAVAASFVFAPARELYFHADDFEWIRASKVALERRDVALPSDVNGHFRPAPELLWLVEFRSFGLDARLYHGVHVALHVLTALAVAMLGARMTGSAWGGLAAGGLFGVNVATRTVPIWLSASSDLLLGFGAALALAAFHGAVRPRVLGAAGFVLALLSKETGLVLPVVVLLVTPWMARRNKLRWALIASTAALAVPHAVAAAFSTYVRGRFHPGTQVPLNLLELASGLLLPPAGASSRLGALPFDLAAGSPSRIALGLFALVVVLGVAATRLGTRTALRLAAAIVVTLLVPALARGELEPRWLYLPWVVLAPVVAAALVQLGTWASRRLPRAGLPVVVGAAMALHLAAHGSALRAKIARDLGRDAWVRGVVTGARDSPPPLLEGAEVEVLVPFGAELRSWPVGIELALGRRLTILPVDDRSGPSGLRPLLDATVVPARWRRTPETGAPASEESRPGG